MSRLAALAAVVALALAASPASADVLEKVEKNHTQPKSEPSKSDSSKSSSSSSSSSSAASDVASAVFSGLASDDDASSNGELTWACLIPGPWTGNCIYGRRWLRADRSERASSLAPVGPRTDEDVAAHRNAPRYGELTASGLFALNHEIYGFDVGARAWLGLGAIDLSWLRLQEPGATSLDHLDLLRGAFATAFLAEKFVEAHLLLGVDVLHGRDWTPGFGPGAEVRVHPTPHFHVVGAFRASIFFEAGDPLYDSRLEAGFTLGRLDARVGGRWIEQVGAASILGPTARILIRLGP